MQGNLLAGGPSGKLGPGPACLPLLPAWHAAPRARQPVCGWAAATWHSASPPGRAHCRSGGHAPGPAPLQVCEEGGCFAGANPSKVSERAKKRGLVQLGSLGSGNHYTEMQVGGGGPAGRRSSGAVSCGQALWQGQPCVHLCHLRRRASPLFMRPTRPQVVDEIFDPQAAAVMGIDAPGQVQSCAPPYVPAPLQLMPSRAAPLKGPLTRGRALLCPSFSLVCAPQVCIMIHTGSRGLGHQVCTDALTACDRRVHSPAGRG